MNFDSNVYEFLTTSVKDLGNERSRLRTVLTILATGVAMTKAITTHLTKSLLSMAITSATRAPFALHTPVSLKMYF